MKWTECTHIQKLDATLRDPVLGVGISGSGIKSRWEVTSERKLGVLAMAMSLRFLPVVVCLGITAVAAMVFLHSVDLKPQVGENFFFQTTTLKFALTTRSPKLSQDK